jgi:hypothetical protein
MSVLSAFGSLLHYRTNPPAAEEEGKIIARRLRELLQETADTEGTQSDDGDARESGSTQVATFGSRPDRRE